MPQTTSHSQLWVLCTCLSSPSLSLSLSAWTCPGLLLTTEHNQLSMAQAALLPSGLKCQMQHGAAAAVQARVRRGALQGGWPPWRRRRAGAWSWLCTWPRGRWSPLRCACCSSATCQPAWCAGTPLLHRLMQHAARGCRPLHCPGGQPGCPSAGTERGPCECVCQQLRQWCRALCQVPPRPDVIMFSLATAAILHCYSDSCGEHRSIFRSKYLNVLDFILGNTGAGCCRRLRCWRLQAHNEECQVSLRVQAWSRARSRTCPPPGTCWGRPQRQCRGGSAALWAAWTCWAPRAQTLGCRRCAPAQVPPRIR